MSERYFITGVQIGMLKAFLEVKEFNKKEFEKLLNEIEEQQYLCDAKTLKAIKGILRGKK